MEEKKVIEKHILRYLYIHKKFKFIINPGYYLYKEISYNLEKELEVSIVDLDEINNILEKLVESKLLDIEYNDDVLKKGGIISVKDYGSTILDYMIDNGYVDIKLSFDYTDQYYSNTIDGLMKQIEKLKQLEQNIIYERDCLLDKISIQEKQIKDFYNNILNILGILVAVFSIIGFNIGGIKFIVGTDEIMKPWVYAGSIGVINLCIIFSIYFLLSLVNKIINPKECENRKYNIFSTKTLALLLLMIIIIIVSCFIIA